MARKHSHKSATRVSEIREHMRTAHGFQTPFLAPRSDDEIALIHLADHAEMRK